MSPRDGEHELADPPRRERVRRDAARGSVDRPARLEGLRQCGRQLGLDADDPSVARVPAGHAADQPAAADRHQHRVERGRLSGELHAERALAEHRFRLIERVHRERARLGDPVLAGRERVGVALAHHGDVGAVRADLLDLRRRRHGRHEDLRPHAQAHRRVGDGGAVVTAGGGRHADRGQRAQEQIGERAPRLERSGVLQELELERERKGRKPEVRAAEGERRRDAHVRRDDGAHRLDALLVDRHSAAPLRRWPPHAS